MSDIELYRDSGLEIYEKVHYSHGEHLREVAELLSWYKRSNARILDLGCSGGLHALELARLGHFVTGIDIEPAAIDLARKRNSKVDLQAGFLVVDLENGDLSGLGTFDLVYSLGNVLSHISKKSLPVLLEKIRDCLVADGILLFDVVHVGEEFPEEVNEQDLHITWSRDLDRQTGKIRLRGDFLDYGLVQDFQVWGMPGTKWRRSLSGRGSVGLIFRRRWIFPTGRQYRGMPSASDTGRQKRAFENNLELSTINRNCYPPAFFTL
jgi:SAM-dependent methyltransferase